MLLVLCVHFWLCTQLWMKQGAKQCHKAFQFLLFFLKIQQKQIYEQHYYQQWVLLGCKTIHHCNWLSWQRIRGRRHHNASNMAEETLRGSKIKSFDFELSRTTEKAGGAANLSHHAVNVVVAVIVVESTRHPSPLEPFGQLICSCNSAQRPSKT